MQALRSKYTLVRFIVISVFCVTVKEKPHACRPGRCEVRRVILTVPADELTSPRSYDFRTVGRWKRKIYMLLIAGSDVRAGCHRPSNTLRLATPPSLSQTMSTSTERRSNNIWWSNAVFFLAIHLAAFYGIHRKPFSSVSTPSLVLALAIWQSSCFGCVLLPSVS